MSYLVRAVCLLSLVLSACTLPKKEYHQPVLPVMEQWPVENHNTNKLNDKNLPYLAWWKDFNDPTLDDLIIKGLTNNNSLNMSRASIDAAEGELKKINYQWIPTVDLMTGYSRNPATGYPGLLGVVIPSYIINIYQQIKEQKRAKYTLALIKAEDDALKLIIISQICASYFTYQAEVERKQLLRTLANDLKQLARIAQNTYKGGLISDIEQQELYSQAQMILGELEVVERNIIVSQNAIRYLINLNPGEFKSKRRFSDLNNKQLIPGALPLTVLENRPDLQMADSRLRAANQNIGIARAHLLPTLTFDLIGGKAAGNNAYRWPQKNVYFNDQLFKLPLLKASVLGEIATAKGLDKHSYYHYVDTLQKALRDTTNALATNERFTKKYQITAKAQRYLNKAYGLNRRLYQQGIQNYIDMLKARIALDRININLNEDKLLQLMSIVNLYQELAGGYKGSVEKIE